MRLKALFTGGGTAGHVAPNIAVIEELTKIAKRRDVDLDILYVGRFRGIERDLILKERLKYKGVFSGKIRRYFSWRNFTDPILVFFGFFQSIFIVFSFKPDVVFAKGGFVTVPVGLAAWIRKIPLIVHESDSMLGLSNKVLSKIATRLALGFPLELYRGIPLSKAIFTGNPVRKDVKEFDLNRDSIADVKVTLNGVSGSDADFTITRLQGADALTAETTEPTTGQPTESDVEGGSSAGTVIIWIVILVVLVLIVWLVAKKKR